MKRLIIKTSMALVLGLGLTLAVLWLLSGRPTPATAAPALSEAEGLAERPLRDATPTHYVAITGTDSGNCSTPVSACLTIQYAVDQAGEGDEIRVATGTYTDVNNYSGLAQIVYISKTITIQGGYTTAFTEPPDPEANPTTLDAQGQGRVLYITGNISPTIEGLRITGGDASALNDQGGGVYVINATATISNNRVFSNTADWGGGLYLTSSDATLSSNTVTTNTASYDGGGLLLSDSAATLSGNTISANSAGWAGGGLFLGNSDATLSGNTVSSNSANDGGGLNLYYSDATLNSNIVISNTADDGGGLFLWYSDATLSDNTVSANTAYGNGGGLSLSYSAATLSGNTISSNTATHNGGGLYLKGSAATLSGNTVISNTATWGGGLNLFVSDAMLSGNTVISNTAEWGGGLYLNYSPAATLSGNTVSSNSATLGGGGLLLFSSDATLSGNTVSSNTASRDGGGLLLLSDSDATLSGNTVTANTANLNGGGLSLGYSNATLVNNLVADNQANSLGSGLYIESSSPRLLHTTVAHNSGGDGSGVYVTDEVGNYSTVALTNTILVSHTVGIYVTAGNTTTLEGTLWGSGAWANGTDWSGDGTVITGTVNVWGDPAFLNPDYGDYHIGSDSAAIDVGVDAGVSVDIDGEPRPAGTGYDIGADEFQHTVTPPTLSGLPDQMFDHSTGPPSTIDLWAYASDAETPVSGLTYALEGTPPTGAGVSLDGNRYVHVDPSTSWCGWTGVTVRVTDPGGLWDSDTFRVAVTWSCRGPINPPGTPTPVAPTDGSTATSSRPTFTWHAVADADEYQIQVDDDADLTRPEVDETTTSTEYTPASGLSGGIYYWRVRASNAYGAGAWSAEQEFTVLTPSPAEFKLYLPVVLKNH